MKTYNLNVYLFALIIFLTAIISSESFAQSINGINDQIGGSGSTSTSVSQSDDALLYIVGGVVIAAIIVYALTRDKKDKQPEKDSSKTSLNLELYELDNSVLTPSKKELNTLPVDIYFGLQNATHFSDTKKYVLGLRLSL